MQSSLSQTTLWGFFFCATAARGAGLQLAAVSKTVLSLRDYAKSHPNVHGAVPDVTLAKHQIRDWIESRLATFPEKGDEAMLSNYFRSGISNAKLFCDDDSDCVPTALGFLDEIQVNRDHGLLAITTAVGTGIRAATITPVTFTNGKRTSGSASGRANKTITRRARIVPRFCIRFTCRIPAATARG